MSYLKKMGGRRYSLQMEPLESRRLLAVADFSLSDVNPTSESYNQSVSPYDFTGQVSGWYFGHAT